MSWDSILAITPLPGRDWAGLFGRAFLIVPFVALGVVMAVSPEQITHRLTTASDAQSRHVLVRLLGCAMIALATALLVLSFAIEA